MFLSAQQNRKTMAVNTPRHSVKSCSSPQIAAPHSIRPSNKASFHALCYLLKIVLWRVHMHLPNFDSWDVARMFNRQARKIVLTCCLYGGLLASLLLMASCGGDSGQKGDLSDQEKAQANLPAPRVDLPTPPRLGDDPIPVTWPDGTLSVYGVMRYDEKYLDSKVKVTGLVDAVYACPEGTSPCDEPHFFMTDGVADLDYRLMVVSTFKEDDEFHKELVPGAKLQVSGTFSRQSMHGFLNSRGLLDAEEIVKVVEKR